MTDEAKKPEGNNDPSAICETCEVVLRIGIFYDGTSNNAYNTEIGRAYSGQYPDSHAIQKENGFPDQDRDQSYRTNKSNIWKLHQAYPYTDTEKNVAGEHYVYGNFYVSGIGTITAQPDSHQIGAGADFGPTNAVAKAEEGIARATTFANKWRKLKHLKRVEVDIFGFSRGAAAARHASNIINDHSGLYTSTPATRGGNTNTTFVPAHIKFIGLYDTVTTHGILPPESSQMSAPNKWAPSVSTFPTRTHLPAGIADDEVYQLVANNEHRKYYPSISILNNPPKSLPVQLHVNTEGNHKEQYVTGAHSDVGGGYTNDDLSRIYFHMMYDEGKSKGVPFDRPGGETDIKPGLSSAANKLQSGDQLSSDDINAIQGAKHESSVDAPLTQPHSWPDASTADGARVVYPNTVNP